MAQEYAFDALARVFNNAADNWAAEQQRQRRLDDERAYEEKIHDRSREEAKADRDEQRDYDKTLRKTERENQREDAIWAHDQALVASLIQNGFLKPADAKNPDKIAEAWVNLTPEAKQRVSSHKQAIEDIAKMVGQFGTMGIEGAATPEMLSAEEAFRIAGEMRQKAAAVKQRTGTRAADLMVKADKLQADYDQAAALIDPTVTDDDMRMAAASFGAAAADPRNAEMIQIKAGEIAQQRAGAANARARSIAGQIQGVNSQINALDNLSRAGIYLPEQPAAPAAPSAPQGVTPTDAGGDPMAAFLDPDGSKAKAKAEAARVAAEAEAARAARNPFAAQAERDRIAAAALQNANAFIDIYPSASQTDDQLRTKVRDALRPSPGFGSYTGGSLTRTPSNAELASKFDSFADKRDTDLAQAKELFSAFKDYIDMLPPDKKQQVAQMAALFQNPTP